ncbi:MAG TPA: DoxX family protein [Rhodanobacteraceae bacterium]|nr:DoxX family protein [Rhodanobacteraceae bacterium]
MNTTAHSPLHDAADLLGRVFLVVLYVTAGIGKLGAYSGTAGYMAAHGVPGVLLPLVILTELAGSLLILLGWHTRIVAFLLAGFTLLTLVFFHLPLGAETNQIILWAELGCAGGFLLLVAHGAGAWSLDARRRRRRVAPAITA